MGQNMWRVGLLVLLYTFWTVAFTFASWFGLAFGVGGQGYKFSPWADSIFTASSFLSVVVTMVGSPILLTGSVALMLGKLWGRGLSSLGLWAVATNALLLDVSTFLLKYETGGRGLLDFLDACIVVVAMTALYVGPALPIFKKLRGLS